MIPQTVFLILVAITITSFVFERILVYFNLRNMKDEIPSVLHKHIDRESYILSQNYLRDNTRLSNLSSTASFLLLMIALFFGLFSWLDMRLIGAGLGPIWHTLAFFAVIAIASSILSLPFSIWTTFVIEEKYGFNRSSLRTFLLDLVKSAFLALIIGGGLLAFVTWLYLESGQWFWILAWIALSLFSLVMTLLYSDVIVPLFNKQRPLEEGDLRTAILRYAKDNKFKIKNIYVIDGSRRSSKANAYFSGFGPRKRIVLYDTLIQEHPIPELVAVLAHEVGHYRHRHVLKGTVLSILESGVTLFILSLFIRPGSSSSELFASSLGAVPSFHIGILVFGILYSPISMLSGLFDNMLSRRHEFQADAFAATTFSGKFLSDALIRLSVKHLSNLYPHPLYVKFNYSHPPLLQRLAALMKADPGIDLPDKS
jgi:STE24 endopeptidase